jgi:hypothetical protein
LKKEEFKESKFLKSIHTELINCGSQINALVFLASMTMQELIDLNEAIKEDAKNDEKSKYGYTTVDMRHGTRTITISKDTECGLYDAWSGGGSVLEIALDKDVVLPMRFIDSAKMDGMRGRYGIASVYGVCSSLWRGDVTINEEPKEAA